MYRETGGRSNQGDGHGNIEADPVGIKNPADEMEQQAVRIDRSMTGRAMQMLVAD
jgi:hypothetical protein